MALDEKKLAELKARGVQRLGGKGTPRRKVIKKTEASSGANDQKLQGKLKGLNVQAITGVEEVNMFKDDGNVLHFTAPKVHAALPSNTMAIYGSGQTKELTELVPGILSQLGPDSLASLRKLAAQYQSQTAAAQAAAGGAEGIEAKADDDDDDDIPELVDTFEPDEKEKEEEKETEAPKEDEKDNDASIEELN